MAGTSRSPARGSDLLAIGFGMTVAMWATGYVCRLPSMDVPNWLLLVLLLACVVGGGVVAGRYAGGARRAAQAGVLTAALNMLVLGSLLGGRNPNQIVPSALWWVPGSILVTGILAAAGGALGAALPARGACDRNWTGAFVVVAAAATGLLVIIGGVVTSQGAGLAVVDWPNSFGWNMFLYPLSRMTGGVYYEHTHRLLGSLVGLTTVTMAVQLLRTEDRRWVKRFAFALVAAVIVQGILGGLRVTGRFTLSTRPEDTAPSLVLAIVHGVVGQAFFGCVVAMAVFVSRAWRAGAKGGIRPSVATDRGLNAALVVLLVVQLVLGAIQRHLVQGLLIHISLAVVVTVVAVACGARAWGLYPDRPALHRLGRLLIALILLQVVLGVGALVVTGVWPRSATPTPLHVIVTTAHQAVGASLLASSVMLMLWYWAPETGKTENAGD